MRKKKKCKRSLNNRSIYLPGFWSMLKLELDIWAGGGDMNFDKDSNEAILS